MTDRKQIRALNAFAAMDSLSDDYILAAEQMLYEAEAGIARSAKPETPFRRFLNSGWGAAVISGVVALTVLIFIIRAGKEPPTSPPPPTPAGSTIEMSEQGASYSLIMDYENYPEGTDSLLVAMVGKNKGESISTPGGWHLERITEEGAEAVGISYTEEFTQSAKPADDAYASLKKAIRIEGSPLTPGTYRLHATKHDGEKYVSVAWCEFTVGSEQYPPEADDSLYTLSVPNTTYGSVDITVTVTAKGKGEALPAINRGWKIVKLAGHANTGNTEIKILEYGVEPGDPPDADSYATYTESLILEDPSAWLPGIYRLYDLNSAGESVAHCDFVIYEEGHVPLTTDDPDRMVVPGIFLWADNTPMILMMDYYDGLYPEPAASAANATVYPTLLNDQTDGGFNIPSGSVVEIVMGKKITYPNHGVLYDLRIVAEGTLDDVNENWLIALRGAGYTITPLPS